jgi:hypothetical protein
LVLSYTEKTIVQDKTIAYWLIIVCLSLAYRFYTDGLLFVYGSFDVPVMILYGSCICPIPPDYNGSGEISGGKGISDFRFQISDFGFQISDFTFKQPSTTVDKGIFYCSQLSQLYLAIYFLFSALLKIAFCNP